MDRQTVQKVVMKDYIPEDTCRDIWSAVIEQAMVDATYGLSKKYHNGTINIDKKRWTPPTIYIREYREAQEWFLDPTLDFEEVCGYVGLNPKAVHEQAIYLFKEINKYLPDEWRIKDLNDNVL